MEIPREIPSECGEGDKPVEGDLWVGTAQSEGLSAGEKTRRIVHNRTPRERPVSGEARETTIGEIIPLYGVRGLMVELKLIS